MHSTLTSDQQARYTTARANGLPASHAYRVAVDTAATPDYTQTGGVIRFDTTDPAHAGFTITAAAEPDPDPDLSWLGTFNNTWAPGALTNSTDPRRCRYFHPTYTVAQHRADLTARGYPKGHAHTAAARAAHDDHAHALEYQEVVVTVTAAKAGVDLGTATISVGLHPSVDDVDTIVAAIQDHRLIDEAVAQANETLSKLRGCTTSDPVVLLPDPNTRDGAAILDLFTRLKHLEHGGGWPGADVVDQLTDWLPTVGIDPDESVDEVLARLRAAPPLTGQQAPIAS